MKQQTEIDKNTSQPQITIQESKGNEQKTQAQQNSSDVNHNPKSHEKAPSHQDTVQVIKEIKKKHPDCIPVFYVKHEACPKQFASPQVPFILFKKQLKIEQAMYNLYNQIKIKQLYFFCTRYNSKQQRLKYVVIRPGETIEQIYNKYGKDGYLTLIYGDKNIGMQGVNRVQKWLIRILIFLAVFWLVLYGYPMYKVYEKDGLSGVWNVISFIRKGANQDTSNMQTLQGLKLDQKIQTDNKDVINKDSQSQSYKDENIDPSIQPQIYINQDNAWKETIIPLSQQDHSHQVQLESEEF